jgi:transposase
VRGITRDCCDHRLVQTHLWRRIRRRLGRAIRGGDAFTKGRDFAAWLGLVPKQISTGDRTILGKISKRGNRYLRVLFVQAAWVVLIKPKSWEPWGVSCLSSPPHPVTQPRSPGWGFFLTPAASSWQMLP